MKKLLLILLVPGLVFAQAASAPSTPHIPFATRDIKCLPALAPAASSASGVWIGSESWIRVSKTCVCGGWSCLKQDSDVNAPVVRDVVFCGTWAEQAKVSPRIDTIQKNADPLKSLQGLDGRIVIQDMYNNPAFADCPKTP